MLTDTVVIFRKANPSRIFRTKKTLRSKLTSFIRPVVHASTLGKFDSRAVAQQQLREVAVRPFSVQETFIC